MGSVSRLPSDRVGLALLTRVKREKEKRKKFCCCSFSKAVFRLTIEVKVCVMRSHPVLRVIRNFYDSVSDLCYESLVCHSIKQHTGDTNQ